MNSRVTNVTHTFSTRGPISHIVILSFQSKMTMHLHTDSSAQPSQTSEEPTSQDTQALAHALQVGYEQVLHLVNGPTRELAAQVEQIKRICLRNSFVDSWNDEQFNPSVDSNCIVEAMREVIAAGRLPVLGECFKRYGETIASELLPIAKSLSSEVDLSGCDYASLAKQIAELSKQLKTREQNRKDAEAWLAKLESQIPARPEVPGAKLVEKIGGQKRLIAKRTEQQSKAQTAYNTQCSTAADRKTTIVARIGQGLEVLQAAVEKAKMNFLSELRIGISEDDPNFLAKKNADILMSNLFDKQDELDSQKMLQERAFELIEMTASSPELRSVASAQLNDQLRAMREVFYGGEAGQAVLAFYPVEQRGLLAIGTAKQEAETGQSSVQDILRDARLIVEKAASLSRDAAESGLYNEQKLDASERSLYCNVAILLHGIGCWLDDWAQRHLARTSAGPNGAEDRE